jgi:hypothetical protein
MPNVLMIAVALWAALFMVAAYMTVMQWRRSGGQPSTPVRDRRGASAGLAGAGAAGREAAGAARSEAAGTARREPVTVPVRKPHTVRQIPRPDPPSVPAPAGGPAEPGKTKVRAEPERTQILAESGQAKVPAESKQAKAQADAERTMPLAELARAILAAPEQTRGRAESEHAKAQADAERTMPLAELARAILAAPEQTTAQAEPERMNAQAKPGHAGVPAEHGRTAEPQVSVVADAEPGQDRPAAEPDKQQADADVVTISERIARFYEEADRPVADRLTALGWTREPHAHERQ